ncbi:MAG: transcription elongation factor GreA [Dehalococcoidia bacterium]|nr:transcription elongation factor GreA [Dehalococcoidia bacterium]
MTTEKKTSVGINLGEAASRYQASLTESERTVQQPEINRFVRWFGSERQVAGLNAGEVANYAERQSQMDSDFGGKTDPLKSFLAHIRKEKLNPVNLAIGIKIKKGKSRNTGPTQKLKREPVPMTKAKFDELTAELAVLRTRRIEVIADIQRAAADKDFKENAPFHAAREAKGHIDGKILEIDEMLACAVITDETTEKAQTVCVGNTIVLEPSGGTHELRFKIVNPKEVAPSKGKISTISPIGKSALGRTEGDIIEVIVPAGKLQYRIIRIER